MCRFTFKKVVLGVQEGGKKEDRCGGLVVEATWEKCGESPQTQESYSQMRSGGATRSFSRHRPNTDNITPSENIEDKACLNKTGTKNE